MISDPSPEPRSIQELYYEALNVKADYPENNITPHGGQSADWILAPTHQEINPQPAPPARSGEEDSGADSNDPVIWKSREDRAASGAAVRPATGTYVNHALVTDIFDETDVRQAIQSLAGQAGVKVVLDDSVGGFVSAVIEDEPFDEALQQVLLPLGLVSAYVDGQYLIATDDPESSLFAHIAESAEYQPEHRPPQELLEMLAPRLQRYVRVVEHSNAMMVEAPRASLETILVQLRQFDRPVPQVVLEAIVCVLSPETGVHHGLDWQHALTVGDQGLLNLGLTGLTFGGSVTPFGLRNWANDFAVTSVFVRLLAQEGYLTIRAAPRVMAKDGEQAEISIGRETYFSTQPISSDLVFRTDIERVEAGIELNITPTIRGDNITVKIEKAEVSEDIRTEDLDIRANPYPLINRRRVSTTVNVKDGETIVIGGLATRQTVDRVGRVPYLGDMPLFGKLFRIVEADEQDVEVVIFISPRLVNNCDTGACPPRSIAPGSIPTPIEQGEPPGPSLLPPPVVPHYETPAPPVPRPERGIRQTSGKLPPPRVIRN